MYSFLRSAYKQYLRNVCAVNDRHIIISIKRVDKECEKRLKENESDLHKHAPDFNLK